MGRSPVQALNQLGVGVDIQLHDENFSFRQRQCWRGGPPTQHGNRPEYILNIEQVLHYCGEH